MEKPENQTGDWTGESRSYLAGIRQTSGRKHRRYGSGDYMNGHTHGLDPHIPKKRDLLTEFEDYLSRHIVTANGKYSWGKSDGTPSTLVFEDYVPEPFSGAKANLKESRLNWLELDVESRRGNLRSSEVFIHRTFANVDGLNFRTEIVDSEISDPNGWIHKVPFLIVHYNEEVYGIPRDF